MTKMQNKDFEECVEMQERGEDKDCFGCSCNGCIAQEPDYTDLLQECYNELAVWITEECALMDRLKMVLGID